MSLIEKIRALAEAAKDPAARGRAAGGKASASVFSRARQLLSKRHEGGRKFRAGLKDEPKTTKQMAAGQRTAGTKSHNPFKRRSVLGPTKIYRVRPPSPPPRGTRTHVQRRQWSCKKIAAYKQMCTGIGQKNKGKKLKININKAYKGRYNKAFKRHRTLKRAEARREGKRPTY